MFDLIRFTKPEHVESTLSGHLYMNSIGYFWEHGFEDQKDIYEGIHHCEAPEQSDFAKRFTENLQRHLTGNIMWRNEAVKYCNVLCFYKLNRYQDQCERISPEIMEFGEAAIHIFNVDEFIRRLFVATRAKRDFCWCAGRVVYYHPHGGIILDKDLDCFCKTAKHSYQKEWRLVVINNYSKKLMDAKSNPNAKYTDSYILDMPDIHDIARVINTNDLIKHQEKYFPKYKIKDSIPESKLTPQIADVYYLNRIRVPLSAMEGAYWGYSVGEKTSNVRTDFANKIIQLANGYAKPFLVFGKDTPIDDSNHII